MNPLAARRTPLKSRAKTLSIVLIGTIAVVLGLLWRVLQDSGIGAADFGAYWSASRLLFEGRNPCDSGNILEMERRYVNPNQSTALMAWNPPTLWVLMLPMAMIPFRTARILWFFTNMGLIWGTCLLLQRIFLSSRSQATSLLFFALPAFFSPTLITLGIGQITPLVFFGLTFSLYLAERERFFWAGAALLLISPKPHLVLLAGPYLLLRMAMHRDWRGWLGFAAASALCTVTLFALRPTWIADFSAHLRTPPVNWLTPTLGGVMASVGFSGWPQVVGVGLLALLPFLVHPSTRISAPTAVSLLTALTIPLTFFGWSFDQILLLIPLAEIIYWTSAPSVSRKERIAVGLAVAVVMLGGLVQRWYSTNEIEYFWVPVAWLGIYCIVWSTLRQRSLTILSPEPRSQ